MSSSISSGQFFCILDSEYDPDIHDTVSIHIGYKGCSINCKCIDCESSSSSSPLRYFCVLEKASSSSSSSQTQQNLFNKNSWSISVPEPYKTYLDQSADRWSQFVKFNPSVFSSIKSLDPAWDGIALEYFSQFNSPTSGVIASCGPTEGVDFTGDAVKFNSTLFGLSVNDYYNGEFSAGDWVNIITHELGHALGIGVFWDPAITGITGGVAPSDNFLDGVAYDNAQQAYNSITSSSRQKVPLEDQGGDGTESAHWEDDYRPSTAPGSLGVGYAGLSNELMVGFYSPGSNSIISDLSIKTLVDFGYEAVAEGVNEGIPVLSTGTGMIGKLGSKLNCKMPDEVKITSLNLPASSFIKSLSAGSFSITGEDELITLTENEKEIQVEHQMCPSAGSFSIAGEDELIILTENGNEIQVEHQKYPMCIPEEEFDSEIYDLIAIHDNLESCESKCGCFSSSSSNLS